MDEELAGHATTKDFLVVRPNENIKNVGFKNLASTPSVGSVIA
jgi:hypothetical protein